MSRILTAVVVTLFGLSSCQETTVAATLSPPDVAGIYSSMNFIPEAGDLVGIELQIIYSRGGYSVLFQDAEGVLRKPYLVDAAINHDKIEFILPERNGYSGKFIGVLTKSGLIGSFGDGQVDANGNSKFTLRKIKCNRTITTEATKGDGG